MRKNWHRLNLPAIFLFLLSPAMGELLSGSSPPPEYFMPFGLISMHLMYGGGAVIIREILMRRRLGWVSAILLGISYAILEEGVAVQSFFSPYWVDLGKLAKYGRFAGVNWVWLVHLTIYHTFFSIYLPILITNNLFQHKFTFIKNRNLIALITSYILIVIFCAIMMPKLIKPLYIPSAVYFVTSFLVVIICLWGSLKIKRRVWQRMDSRVLKPYMLTILSVLIICGYIAILEIFPRYDILFMITCISLLLWTTIWCAIILHWRHSKYWTQNHTINLIYGVMLVFIAFAPLQELDHNRKDNTAGMSLVGFVFLLLMETIRRKIKQHSINEIIIPS